MTGSRRFRRAVATSVAAAAVLVIVFPSVITSQNPVRGRVLDRLQSPNVQHLLGTDQLGRDVLARILHGASLSLAAAALAVLVAVGIGSVVGLVAGSGGARLDALLMRAVDVVLAIPSLLLVLVIVVALGFDTADVAFAVGLSASATYARIMRTEVLRVRGAGFVESARVSGLRSTTVTLVHVLPNAAIPTIGLITLEFGNAVLTVAALSYLGFGASPPTPEWGAMIAEGQNYIDTAWWLTAFPGLAIVAVVVPVNYLGTRIRERGSR